MRDKPEAKSKSALMQTMFACGRAATKSTAKASRGDLSPIRQDHQPFSSPKRNGGGCLSCRNKDYRRTHRRDTRLQPKEWH